MLIMNDIAKVYRTDTVETHALRQFSLTVDEGEFVSVTGPSGSGKTTFLNIAGLLEEYSSGTYKLDGKDVSGLNDSERSRLRNEKIGFIFQEHHLLFDRTVFDNVALPLIIAGYRHQEIGRRVRAALDKLGLLSKERLYPITLSGGEQQRVGIARAVVNKPMLLLADEPTGNLDPELSREIMSLFSLFNDVGVSVIIASHDIPLIEELDYPVLSLDQGRLTHTAAGAA